MLNETHYHIRLTDEERLNMERESFNFHTAVGYNMRIPPKLYADLKSAGVSMKYIDADPALEN